MQKTIEVVDDFYQNPMAVREHALRNTEWIQSSPDEHGLYDARTATYTPDEEVKQRIVEILGQAPGGTREMAVIGYFTFIGDGASNRLVPHVHNAEWAAVIYLSLPDQCSGGISFYRHADSKVSDPTNQGKSNLPSQAWEETTCIPIRFNRLVLFKASSLFHCATGGFGQTTESGRLAQVFLVNEVSPQVTK